ncbi:MAG TPA: two-component regulator propeller domain-containing protein [Cyclobacteriaceae bacterium]|jgi:ligand-binding sensor domain-containing protein|nr:two-component regulator propeller domain-containing protein [Cyclobacteriaceae bacterium]
MKIVYALFLTFIFCASGKGQNKTENKNASPYGPSVITRNVIQDRKGNLWLATWDGVFRYDAKGFTNFTGGVSTARFFSLLEDSKGNLWFGSIGSGVYRYDGIFFQNFTTTEGLYNNEVGCMYEDKKGIIWFGVNGGASRYDGKSFRNFMIEGDSIVEDKTRTKSFPNMQRPPMEVTSIIEDRAGKYWLSTRGNTFVYDGKKFRVIARDGKPFKNVRCMIEDRKGNIWLAGNDGLWRYDGNTFTNITYNFVGYVYEDRNGNIWTSSTGNMTALNWVLSRYDEKSLANIYVTIPKIVEPNAGGLFGILEDAQGYIWVGSIMGVYRYDGNTVIDFKAPPLNKK